MSKHDHKFIIQDELSMKDCMRNVFALWWEMPEVKWEVLFRVYKDSKTLRQLRLYWKWVKVIGDEFGEHKTDMSEYLKSALLEPRIIEIKGNIQEVRPSIANMKIDEMSEYLTSVSRWAGSHNIRLPHPEDLHAN